MFVPAYIELHARGGLEPRVRESIERLRSCDLCPRDCRVDRSEDERGDCEVGRAAQVASSNLHFGEESPLVGTGGSGTIFFAGCNLHCHFCQNYDISHIVDRGAEVTARRLASIMLDLQRQGASNINFVTPSHVVPQILEALPLAIDDGLNLPIVYNTSGYDTVETLKLLEGIVDIYMPDAKVFESHHGRRFCQADDYPERACAAMREMHRQVGDLELDERGVATRGLLVRHLVMPAGTAGTREWMKFLSTKISTNTYVNIMAQYRPCGRVASHRDEFPDITRGVTDEEMRDALQAAADAGITRLDGRRRPSRHLLWQLMYQDD